MKSFSAFPAALSIGFVAMSFYLWSVNAYNSAVLVAAVGMMLMVLAGVIRIFED